MKKDVFFISLIGLMSALSSCDDHFTMDEEKSFTPVMYAAKTPEVLGQESTTLLIKGIEDLVFDEIEKDDWKIITQYRIGIRGNQSLQIGEDLQYKIEDDGFISIPTNYDDILVTFDKLKVTYFYLGKETELMPEGGLNLMVDIEETQKEDDPIFFQTGYIVFRLCVGSFPVKIHKLPFAVYATDEEIDKWIKELEEKEKQENAENQDKSQNQ